MNNIYHMSPVYAFLSGCTMVAALVCALFFLKFWRKSRDRFFAIFAAAFALLGLERLAILFFFNDVEFEVNAPVYLIRLFAFGMIYFAIWDKNRPAKHG